MMSPADISLDPDQVREVFPFFFAFDRDLCVTAFGPAAPKVCPSVVLGASFAELFAMPRHKAAPSFHELVRERTRSLFVDTRGSGIRLRGQLIHIERAAVLLFLCAPWFTDTAQLEKTKFTFSDFSIHDAAVDFLYMAQARTVAVEDARAFSETVARQRDELIESQRALKLMKERLERMHRPGLAKEEG